MRRVDSDTQECEVKEAVGGVPKNLAESISAFANHKGGLIILGLSEKNGFSPAKKFDAGAVYQQMMTIGDCLTPRIHMDVEQVPFENSTVVIARVPALSEKEKPCYVTNRGQYNGSYIRSGDGDRHLTPYEIDRLLEVRNPPKYDIEPVEQATTEDLNQTILDAIVQRAKILFPRVFAKLDPEVILIQLGVLTRINNQLRPTLAGLLVAGHFPQQYFPRLMLTFTVFPGTNKAGNIKTGERYTDSKELIGSIPDILVDTLALVQQRMNTGAVIEKGLRKDIPDYPLVAVREAVANALQHRDYSPEGRGTHVQVNMYADRLEITNPGGLYGSADVDSLGKEGISSTRNEFLSRILTYTPFENGYVVENKGTGFMTIQSALADALMPPPIVKNSLSFFSITFEKRRKTEEERDLLFWDHLENAILTELDTHSSLSISELIDMSGLSRTTIFSHIRKLVKAGKIEPIEPPRSPKQRYRLVRH